MAKVPTGLACMPIKWRVGKISLDSGDARGPSGKPNSTTNSPRAMTDIKTATASTSTERVLRWLFAATALTVMVLSLSPMEPDAPSLGWDKANHMAAFAVLALLGCRAYPSHTGFVLAGLLIYGGLIEVLQSFTSYRQAEWADLLADALGLPLGWAVAWLQGGMRDRR